MKEYLPAVGFLLIFAGIAVIVISSLLSSDSGKTKFAFGGFVGPFPFGFANSQPLLWAVIGLTALIIIINLFLRFPR